jgi:hypothetical protein
MDKELVKKLYKEFKQIDVIKEIKSFGGVYPDEENINWIMVLFVIHIDMGIRFLKEFVERNTNSCGIDASESYKIKMLSYNVLLQTVAHYNGINFIKEFINIIEDYERENK